MKKILASLSIACIIAIICCTLPTFASHNGSSSSYIKGCHKTKGHSQGAVKVLVDCQITYEDGEPVWGETLNYNKVPSGKGGRVSYCGCSVGNYSFSDGSSYYHFD